MPLLRPAQTLAPTALAPCNGRRLAACRASCAPRESYADSRFECYELDGESVHDSGRLGAAKPGRVPVGRARGSGDASRSRRAAESRDVLELPPAALPRVGVEHVRV